MYCDSSFSSFHKRREHIRFTHKNEYKDAAEAKCKTCGKQTDKYADYWNRCNCHGSKYGVADEGEDLEPVKEKRGNDKI